MGPVYLIVFDVAFCSFFVEVSIISYENSCICLSPKCIIPVVSILVISLHHLHFVGEKAHNKCHVLCIKSVSSLFEVVFE